MSSADSSRLRAEDLVVGYGGRPVLDGVSLDVPDAAVTAILGPNGCGKSTLLKTLGRTLRPTAGQVSLDGEDLRRIAPKLLARRIAMLPQAPTAPDGITVADLVARSRQPHQSWLRQWSAVDEAAVEAALDLTGISHLSEVPIQNLSGGQRQRAWIAFVIAQDAEILLLDEPTTFLDLAHAINVLRLVEGLHRDQGRTVVMVLHDLNLAAQHAHHLIVLSEGQVVTQGAPREILTGALLADVFGLTAEVIANPVGDGVLVVPTRPAEVPDLPASGDPGPS